MEEVEPTAATNNAPMALLAVEEVEPMAVTENVPLELLSCCVVSDTNLKAAPKDQARMDELLAAKGPTILENDPNILNQE